MPNKYIELHVELVEDITDRYIHKVAEDLKDEVADFIEMSEYADAYTGEVTYEIKEKEEK